MQPMELGKVQWLRGYELALAQAKRKSLPLLVLFDEVPGCATVRSYGARVLSHPLLVEAAETLFVPVVIYNNVDGGDRQVLEHFGEPSWNNPVVRFVDGQEHELAPRLDGDYSLGGLAVRMAAALRGAHREVPEYLALLAEEEQGRREQAVFTTHCFWDGEVKLGALPGVVATSPGFSDGREAVRVVYDPNVVSPGSLGNAAHQLGLERVDGVDFRYSPHDDKYQLAQSTLRFVPMTPLQRARVNAALGRVSGVERLLSPRQLALWAAIRRHPSAPWPLPAGAAATLRQSFDAVLELDHSL